MGLKKGDLYQRERRLNGAKCGQIACLGLVATAHPLLVEELHQIIGSIVQLPFED